MLEEKLKKKLEELNKSYDYWLNEYDIGNSSADAILDDIRPQIRLLEELLEV